MFKVPERARVRDHPHRHLASSEADGNNGCFILESPEPGWRLAIIASDGEGWEHVSVHAFKGGGERMRTPSWREMCFVKDLCWDEDDEVLQFHPRRADYVNIHQYTLHLWRPLEIEIPRPPLSLV